MLLISNLMIFLVQFEINKHLKIFLRLQIALTLWARAILVVFEKICSCLFISNCTRNHVITYTNRPISSITTKGIQPNTQNKGNKLTFKKLHKDDKFDLTVVAHEREISILAGSF